MISTLILACSLAFAGGDGFDHDHGAFDAVLDGAVGERGVDYSMLASRRGALDAYTAEIAQADVNSFSANQKLAFYINAYNAYTIQLILDNPQVASIRDLDGGNPWDARRFTVAGEQLTLNDIEHRRVRTLGDARIHAAVNCASKGCPPLAPDAFTATGISSELDAAARRWVRTNAYTWSGDALKVNEIFNWYDEDFVSWAGSRDLPSADHADTVAFLKAYGADFSGHSDQVGELSIDVMPYDWSLNRR